MHVLKVSLAEDGSARLDRIEDGRQSSSLFEPAMRVLEALRDYSRKGWIVQCVAAKVKSFTEQSA